MRAPHDTQAYLQQAWRGTAKETRSNTPIQCRPAMMSHKTQKGIALIELALAAIIIGILAVAFAQNFTKTSEQAQAKQTLALLSSIGTAVARNEPSISVSGSAWTQLSASQLASDGIIPLELVASSGNFTPDAFGNTPSVYANANGEVVVISGPVSQHEIQNPEVDGQLFIIGSTASACNPNPSPCALGPAAAGLSTIPSGNYTAPNSNVFYGWHN